MGTNTIDMAHLPRPNFKVNAATIALQDCNLVSKEDDFIIVFPNNKEISIKDLLNRVTALEEAYMETVLLGRTNEKASNSGSNDSNE
jgi:hypothetical protein